MIRVGYPACATTWITGMREPLQPRARPTEPRRPIAAPLGLLLATYRRRRSQLGLEGRCFHAVAEAVRGPG